MCQGEFGISESARLPARQGIKYENTVEHDHRDQPCSNEFETSYAPERREIVYCEGCYLREVV